MASATDPRMSSTWFWLEGGFRRIPSISWLNSLAWLGLMVDMSSVYVVYTWALQTNVPQMLHGAGIFTYSWVILGGKST